MTKRNCRYAGWEKFLSERQCDGKLFTCVHLGTLYYQEPRFIHYGYVCKRHRDKWLKWLGSFPAYLGTVLEDIGSVDVLELFNQT